MTNDLGALIDFYEREKAIDRDKVIEAFEFAFISAYRKMVPGSDAIENIRADVNARKGETTIFATLTVVADDDHVDKFNEVPLSTAIKKDPTVEIGGTVEFNITPKNFGRIAVQTAKQTMMQRLRYAEKEMIYEEFKDRAGDIVSGTVRRFEKSDVIVDLGKFEGRIPQRERVTTEDYNIGDRLRVYVVAVTNETRGPEIILSRSHPNFVRRLFEAEVNEIADRSVELRGLAREAGYRTKIAVYSTDENIDPVGACVGLRGARVKNIVRELNNEKVDIIRWSEDLREFTSEALKPATILSFEMDEENHQINVTVDEEDLSKAIGRRGQNARLSSRLIEWDIQVRKDESQHEQFEAKLSDAAQHLADSLEIEGKLADALFRAGGVSPEIVISMPVDYLAGSLEVEESIAQNILDKANAVVSGGGTAQAAPAPAPTETEAEPESEKATEPEQPVAAESPAEESPADEPAEASTENEAAATQEEE